MASGDYAVTEVQVPMSCIRCTPVRFKAAALAATLLLSIANAGQDTSEVAEIVKQRRVAVEQGDAEAQFILGLRYALGEGVPENDAEAVKWYRFAAEQGGASAQFNLAVKYATGEGVLRSGAAAADWYYKAGLAYLEEGKREDALRCVERIRNLEAVLDLTVPNMFLADQLLRAVYPKN